MAISFPNRPSKGLPEWYASREAYDSAIETALNDHQTRLDAGGIGSGVGTMNYTGSSWPARPPSGGPVIWASSRHPSAPQPPAMVIGDIWIRHPDALEAL